MLYVAVREPSVCGQPLNVQEDTLPPVIPSLRSVPPVRMLSLSVNAGPMSKDDTRRIMDYAPYTYD